MFNLPGVVLASIACLVAIHALRSVLGDETAFELLVDFAVIPARWTLAWDPAGLADLLRQIGSAAPPAEAPARIAFARAVLTEGGPHYWSAATYALLHGSWMHVAMNSVWLAAFGTPVAQRWGPARYLVLALASAIGGAIAHALMHPYAIAPMIGASAAVSGMMGAAARFVFTPPSLVRDSSGAIVPRSRAETLSGLMRNTRAMLFLGIWFLTNILFAVIAGPLGIAEEGIAWEAHVGGFVTGLLLFGLIDRAGQHRPFAP